MDDRIPYVEEALGYDFRRPELLRDALTHPSARTTRRSQSPDAYERLEFLGDRVLGLVVAEMLYTTFPGEKEGDLARRLAALVRRESLARVARGLGIDDALVLSKGEANGHGRTNDTILGDACEAVLGAVFIDGGYLAAATIIRRLWDPMMGEAATPPTDPKTLLQEWAQGRGLPLPVYRTIGSEGPPHDPVFHVTVGIDGMEAVSGRGSSKRGAEQAAATAMLARLAP